MRAVVTASLGSGPALAEVETPTAGQGEIRIRVRSSSLNGFDTALHRGYFADMLEHRFPVVLGKDFAGTVDQVGDGVTEFTTGTEVFGVVMNHQPLSAGALGEYVVVPASHAVAPMPDGLDYRTAGVIGLAGAAAVGVVEATDPREGDLVLVSGATGGVGAFAIQLAAARGATVIATATPGEEADHVRHLGAFYIVDYTRDVPAQVRKLAPEGLDVVLHLAGDPLPLANLLTAGGRFATLLGIGPDQFAGRDIVATSVIASPDRDLLESLAGEVAAGRLRIPIQRSYSLDEVPRAFDDFAAGTLGKLSVTIA
jgi:NADPH:quinone reductase-like Zn-dependent oxidoreductase